MGTLKEGDKVAVANGEWAKVNRVDRSWRGVVTDIYSNGEVRVQAIGDWTFARFGCIADIEYFRLG